MTHSTKPQRSLRQRDVSFGAQAPERPRLPAAFSRCPESRRIMEEMIFNDRFNEEYAGKTVMVGVNEASAIRARNPLPYIGTSSLSSCLGIAAYDPDTGVAAAAHILLAPGIPNLEHVGRMISRTLELGAALGGTRFLVSVFNGRSGNPERDGALAGFLDKLAASLISEGRASKFVQREEHNFVLDARTGHIFTAIVP